MRRLSLSSMFSGRGSQRQIDADNDSGEHSLVALFPDFSIDQIQEMNVKKPLHSNAENSSCVSVGTTHQLTASSSHPSGADGSLSSGRRNIWSVLAKRGYMLSKQDAYAGFTDSDEEGAGLDDGERSQQHRGRFICGHYFDNWFCRPCPRPCKSSPNRMNPCLAFFYGFVFEVKHTFTQLRKYPYIYVYTIIVFTALTAVGLFIVDMVCDRNRVSLLHDAKLEAIDTGHGFSEMFAKSLIPLRSLQQAVMHSEYFKDLPHKIGNYGQPGSAPSVYGIRSTTLKDYRTVTGICDDPETYAKFQEIVANINRNFDYDGIIVNYRLAPFGVFCHIDPMVNTKDFSEEFPMDSSSTIGWDPMFSPNERWKTLLKRVYNDEDEVDIFGPMHDFVQDDVEMFCGHLGVSLPGYNYTVGEGGETTSTWGFVMHFIHWSNLKKTSGIDEHFRHKNLNYHLSRTDKVPNPDEPGTLMDKVVTIATSLSDHGEMKEKYSVSTPIQTPNGEWIMTVSLDCDFERGFLYIKIATVIGMFFVSIMFSLILIERHLHKLLLYKIMPEEAIEKLNRGQTVVERYNIVTIFFSDIVGFTSIAGEMRPIQVMKMLNEFYLELDKISAKHGVYKVETIGDAYMVVSGAPHRIPAPEAAQRVALFALEAMDFVKNFRTSDGDRINIRAGIASGPVVAGVVGQAMPRYCFFGDTVNLASRMESNSEKNKIQCSDLTNRLLQDAPNFTFDMIQRIENGVRGVHLKGKGITSTWWINGVKDLNKPRNRRRDDIESGPTYTDDEIVQSIVLSKQEWTRIGLPDSPLATATSDVPTMVNRISAILDHRLTVAMAKRRQSPMSSNAKMQLREYVSEIATMYNRVNFHNFEHATHVTIAMHKLVDTIAGSADNQETLANAAINGEMWQSSFMRFSMVFACLIHDVEHTGQSNKILVERNHKIAQTFSGPVAERNSIQVALELLYRRRYSALRKAIFPDVQSRLEFGKCVFWSILCTDIASAKRIRECKARFEKVFEVREMKKNAALRNEICCQIDYDCKLCPVLPYLSEVVKYLRLTQKELDEHPEDLQITQEGLERCVTVEHLTQLADVAHLMQSWELFLKFNFRLYKELMVCYEEGLVDDPTDTWYTTQLNFFTTYIFPLADRCEKLCGSDIASLNLLTSARSNMDRWRLEGTTITSKFSSGYKNNRLEDDILAECLIKFTPLV